MTLRSDRPISRWISWVRPPGRPRFTSRSVRSCVDAGSIEYSPVTQPSPGALQPAGRVVGDARRDQHPRLAHREQHRARRPLLEPQLPGHGAQLAGRPAVGPRHEPISDSSSSGAIATSHHARRMPSASPLDARRLPGSSVGQDVRQHQPFAPPACVACCGRLASRYRWKNAWTRGVLVGGLGTATGRRRAPARSPRRTARCRPCRRAPLPAGLDAVAQRIHADVRHLERVSGTAPRRTTSPPCTVRKSYASAITLRPFSRDSTLMPSTNPSGE